MTWRSMARAELEKLAAFGRREQASAHGEKDYGYEGQLEDERDQREARLVELARAGAHLFTDAMLFAPDLDDAVREASVAAFRTALHDPGTIRIERIAATATSIPWAMIY